jgi:hypothetical protein
MARKNAGDLIDRIGRALADPAASTYVANEFLQRILTNLDRADDLYRRRVVSTFLLVVAFVFLDGSVVTGLSVAGFTVQDISSIAILLPAAVAYSYAELASLTVLRRSLIVAYYAVVEGTRDAITGNSLGPLMMPPSSQVAALVLAKEFQGVGRFLMTLGSLVEMLALTVAPSAFLIAAYRRLFIEHGSDNLLIWGTLVVSIVFVLNAAATILGGAELDRRYDRVAPSAH